jgi:hypothetical protein
MLKILATGNWPRGAVNITRVPSSRKIVPAVESHIDRAWQTGRQRVGIHLFDGPMCRLESFRAKTDRLELDLSETSYRIFFGTNLSHPVANGFDPAALANPVGISTALMSADGWLLFGRRNAAVAYYPSRVHPIAGALEPRDEQDIFGGIERELHEELRLTSTDVQSIRCLGIVQDQSLLQPEIIFTTRANLTRPQIESQIDTAEHTGLLAMESRRVAIESALADAGEFTPVGVATLLLFGRDVLGNDWFYRAKLQAGIE